MNYKGPKIVALLLLPSIAGNILLFYANSIIEFPENKPNNYNTKEIPFFYKFRDT